MSPSKPKTADKPSSRETKAASRQTSSGVTPSSAYNPLSGTFYMLESGSTDAATCYINGRFKTIDDADDNSSCNGGGVESECMSNSGSCSGESEDQFHSNDKDKKNGKQSGGVGSDKREKARGKNERKHQRQKERRAQELRDKCSSYLMSRKLEALSQQLVAMGFTQERATMALILNDGHVERSISWLLEGGESQIHEDWNAGGNLKIDISEELSQILQIEKKYIFSRTDIERAVVSYEGDLEKAVQFLQAHCSWNPSASNEEEQKPLESQHIYGETKDEPVASESADVSHGSNVNQLRNTTALHSLYPGRSPLSRSTEARLQVTSPSHPLPEGFGRGLTPHIKKIINPAADLQHAFSHAERRGYNQSKIPLGLIKGSVFGPHSTGVSNIDTSFLSSVTGLEPKMPPVSIKDFHLKEPVVSSKPHPLLNSSFQPTLMLGNSHPPTTFPSSGWSRGLMDVASPLGTSSINGTHDSGLKAMKPTNLPHGYYSQSGFMQHDSVTPQWNYSTNSSPAESPIALSSSAPHSRTSSSTSYGLFSGWAAGLSSSSVDWTSGPMPNCDYRNIDWSMNPPSTTGQALSSRFNSLSLNDQGSLYRKLGEERRFQMSSSLRFDSNDGQSLWKAGGSGPALQKKIISASDNSLPHEWTSPFAGTDVFNLPQAIPSPSL